MKPSLQDEISQNSGPTTRTKPSSNTKQQQQHQDSQQQQQQALKCPRCDSTNTKFCYYNNYSLTQPRHFCKTCRRYWTKGGALRNVPIGGGCRKSKKLKPSSSSSPSSISKLPTAAADSPAFRFFAGISPSIDFQLNNGHALGLDPTTNYSFMGLNYDNNFINSNLNLQPESTNTLASSIESLSSLNQDLHWKLQQQRLAMIFGDSHHDQAQNKDQNQKLLQPILFQNLEAPKQDSCCFNPPRKESAAASTTEWFFGNTNNSYDHLHQVGATNSSRSIGGSAGGSGGWIDNNNSNGVQAWEDLHHFTALP